LKYETAAAAPIEMLSQMLSILLGYFDCSGALHNVKLLAHHKYVKFF